MKRKILLLGLSALIVGALYAQKTQKKVTAYAITGTQKGQSNWTEVRLVDITTGDEVETIYQSKQELQILNARTGKPVVKKDITSVQNAKHANFSPEPLVATKVNAVVDEKIQANLEEKLKEKLGDKVRIEKVKLANGQYSVKVTHLNTNTNVNVNGNINTNIVVVDRVPYLSSVQSDKPFATNSAACAYDEKHERLYYTPMGINQL
ncbi:MAG TPA: hypothetical protein VEA37_08265, partial [Flavobacterium sp.]|nr:hypothetical protein [Flavobacterium sp.]